MKRAILPAFGLALLLSIPAVSQDDGDAATLQQEVETLKKKVEEQGVALKELQAYVDQQKTGAKRLSKSLATAEEEGFLLPAPNNDAKKSLLSGLQDFANVATGEKPKAAGEE